MNLSAKRQSAILSTLHDSFELQVVLLLSSVEYQKVVIHDFEVFNVPNSHLVLPLGFLGCQAHIKM